MSLLERPGVDRVAVANQLEQAWLAELLGGPLVQALQPRHDHRVVEHPAETLLVGDVALDVVGERIAVWEHAASDRNAPGHPEPGVAEQRGRAERTAPAPGAAPRRARARRGRARSATFMKKRSGALSASASVAVLQVAGHDARVVGSVPVARRRRRDEREPEPDGSRRRLSGKAADERDRLASIPQQSLVDRPPPRAAGRRVVERVEQAAVCLPAHERQRRPPKRQVPRCAARLGRGTSARSRQDVPPDRRAPRRPAPQLSLARLLDGSSPMPGYRGDLDQLRSYPTPEGDPRGG